MDESASELVTDAGNFLATLRRMFTSNDILVFYNVDDTFQILVRPEITDDDAMEFEIGIVREDDDESMKALFDMERHAGYVDEDKTMLVLETFGASMSLSKATDTEVQNAMGVVNRIYRYRQCQCGKYLIKDQCQMCFMCQMTLTKRETRPHFCCICQSEDMEKFMVSPACCKRMFHRSCWDRMEKSGCKNCPTCRFAL